MYFLIALAGIALLAVGVYTLCSEPAEDYDAYPDTSKEEDDTFWAGLSSLVGVIFVCVGIVGMLA